MSSYEIFPHPTFEVKGSGDCECLHPISRMSSEKWEVGLKRGFPLLKYPTPVVHQVLRKTHRVEWMIWTTRKREKSSREFRESRSKCSVANQKMQQVAIWSAVLNKLRGSLLYSSRYSDVIQGQRSNLDSAPADVVRKYLDHSHNAGYAVCLSWAWGLRQLTNWATKKYLAEDISCSEKRKLACLTWKL